MTELDLYLILFFVCGVAITIFVLTFLNKVTFYYDTQDFVCSFSQVIIIAGVSALMLAVLDSTQSLVELISSLSILSKALSILMGLATIVAFLYCVRYSWNASLKTNGVMLGALIFFYKIFIGTFLCFAIIGKFQDLIDVKKSTFATRTAAFVFLSLFSWLLYYLINGKRVEAIKTEGVI